jgi:sugar transferase EpsL
MKRALDIALSVLALIALGPVMAILAILIRVKMGSPVLFKQERPGLHGSPFYIVKFRTMRDDVDNRGIPTPDDLRLTRLGRFLRSASLDELPELINVLRGEMSLVGPRPLLTEYLTLYNSRQATRHDVRPGVTGWAQVNGRNAISWEDKLELDAWYVQNQSLKIDFQVLYRTVTSVIKREGISAGDTATAPKFTGSQEPECAAEHDNGQRSGRPG